MEVFKTPKTNTPGTQPLPRLYNDTMLAVRYKTGRNPNNIYTIVERVIARKPCLPCTTHAPAKTARQHQKVPLNIGHDKTGLRKALKEAGAFRDIKHKVWLLAYGKKCGLKLKDRTTKNLVSRFGHAMFTYRQFLLNIDKLSTYGQFVKSAVTSLKYEP